MSLSPYDQGWLLEIDCPGGAETHHELLPAHELRNRVATDLRRLHQKVSRAVSRDPAVGRTLPNGGERLTDLRRILGPRRYHRLILPLLR